MNHTPALKTSETLAASSMDNRVFPSPPAPEIVTSRAFRSSALVSSSSRSRPMNRVSWVTRLLGVAASAGLLGVAASARNAGKSAGNPSMATW